jgi:hypothetical protein
MKQLLEYHILYNFMFAFQNCPFLYRNTSKEGFNFTLSINVTSRYFITIQTYPYINVL